MKAVSKQTNCLNEPLETCSEKPLTGFFRTGCCDTSPDDYGSHTVCALMTDEFLAFSKQSGNDLSTPRPEYGFKGLQAGDRWCLCAPRFMEAYRAGKAPKVILRATNKRAEEDVPLDILKRFAIDIN